ncbi:transposase [Acidithiobacillus sulfuriphilus]
MSFGAHKVRRVVLVNSAEERLKQIIEEVCAETGSEILEREVMPDSADLQVSVQGLPRYPGYPQTPRPTQEYGHPPRPCGGFLSEFLYSDFGRAIEMSAGFGVEDGRINGIR